MILLIDNYDSFVHNLARYFTRLGQETRVVRNDALDADAIQQLRPQAIVLSPGPCGPDQAGCSLEVVRQFWQTIPILGVCLGHQAIAAAFGGHVIRARQPWHGRSSEITHDGLGIFAGLPNPLTVGRYHSLAIDAASLPPELRVTARTGEGEVMALAHATRPVIGVQFHPESVLTEHGPQLLANFLRLAGLPVAELSGPAEVLTQPTAPARASIHGTPVTF